MLGSGQPIKKTVLDEDANLSDEGRELKRLVLERTDSVRKVIDTYQDEYAYQLVAIKGQIESLLSDHEKKMSKINLEHENNVESAIKSMRITVANEFSLFKKDVDSRISDHLSSMEQRFNSILSGINKMVYDQSSNYLGSVSETIDEIKIDIFSIREEFNKSLSSFQVESNRRVLEIGGKLDKVMAKIKSVFKGMASD